MCDGESTRDGIIRGDGGGGGDGGSARGVEGKPIAGGGKPMTGGSIYKQRMAVEIRCARGGEVGPTVGGASSEMIDHTAAHLRELDFSARIGQQHIARAEVDFCHGRIAHHREAGDLTRGYGERGDIADD